MFEASEIAQVKELLDGISSVVILTHKNPDGDAIGSSLGWAHFLKARGIEATVVAPNAYPGFLKWMPGNEDVLCFEEDEQTATEKIGSVDALFILDLNQLNRMGEGLEKIVGASTKPKMLIDHHEEPANLAEIMLSRPGTSSTAEMVYQLINEMGESTLLNKAAAECLYTGIMTDTGSFRFSSTKKSTHEAAAAMIELGVDPSVINQNVENNYSIGRLKLLGYALSQKMEVLKNERTAIISLSSEELKRYHFKKGDTEGLVNYGLSLENIDRAVLMVEDGPIIKMSFRSIGKNYVNVLAKEQFSGGGHKNAAGGKWDGDMDGAIKRFKEVLPQYINVKENA